MSSRAKRGKLLKTRKDIATVRPHLASTPFNEHYKVNGEVIGDLWSSELERKTGWRLDGHFPRPIWHLEYFDASASEEGWFFTLPSPSFLQDTFLDGDLHNRLWSSVGEMSIHERSAIESISQNRVEAVWNRWIGVEDGGFFDPPWVTIARALMPVLYCTHHYHMAHPDLKFESFTDELPEWAQVEAPYNRRVASQFAPSLKDLYLSIAHNCQDIEFVRLSYRSLCRTYQVDEEMMVRQWDVLSYMIGFRDRLLLEGKRHLARWQAAIAFAEYEMAGYGDQPLPGPYLNTAPDFGFRDDAVWLPYGRTIYNANHSARRDGLSGERRLHFVRDVLATHHGESIQSRGLNLDDLELTHVKTAVRRARETYEIPGGARKRGM